MRSVVPTLSALALCAITLGAQSAPPQGTLRITVRLTDEAQRPMPVPRHALLVSENPASATPRVVTTGVDGTAEVKLRPGNYTVESDRPVTFRGKSYQWTQTLDIVANKDVVLELTADNADIGAPGSSTSPAPGGSGDRPLEADPAFLLPRWERSVIQLWTPSRRASGFLADSRGLVVTSQRLVSGATQVEAQFSAETKVAATVLAADEARDVAVVWLDPALVKEMTPVPVACGQPSVPAVVRGDELFALGAPARGDKDMYAGRVIALNGSVALSDADIPEGAAGGPAFAADGRLLGVTSVLDESEERSAADSRLSPEENVCAVLASVEAKVAAGPAPSGVRLPVEPMRGFPADALRDAARARTGRLLPYAVSSSDFDVRLITPVLTYAAQDRMDQWRRRDRGRAGAATGRGGASGRGGEPVDDTDQSLRPLLDFGSWDTYVADVPAVLLVRVTPKFVESFWTTVGRVAASTQGVSLPPIKHFKPGVARLQAFCGQTEVLPIHPFTVTQRVSETDAINEGLYVFDPDALAPSCGEVRFVLYSEKDPKKADSVVVAPAIVEQVWKDFEPYRASR